MHAMDFKTNYSCSKNGAKHTFTWPFGEDRSYFTFSNNALFAEIFFSKINYIIPIFRLPNTNSFSEKS